MLSEPGALSSLRLEKDSFTLPSVIDMLIVLDVALVGRSGIV